jgi:GT2 family glycosyltransferase
MVSVIIVSFNTKELTMSCISSVITMTDGVEYEIIVVDNNSSDGSADAIEKEFSEVKLFREKINHGFSKANNIGIRSSRAKYLFFLNSDTVLLNNAIQYFHDFMEDSANEQVGAVGSVLFGADMERAISYGNFHGLRSCIKGKILEIGIRMMKRIASPVYFMIRNRLREARDNQATYPRAVECISGADLFVRRKALDNAGLFDERYFLYSEEVDLEYRIANAGFARMVIDTPMITHFESKSFSVSHNKRVLMNVSRLLFFKINRQFPVFLIFYLFTLACSVTELLIDLLLREYSVKENLLLIAAVIRVQYPVKEW